jgi:hypothetical protein
MCRVLARMTVQDFYRDTRRQESEESTFGLAWTSQSDPTAYYGLHWLKSTKETYLLRGPLLPPFLPGLLEGAGGGNLVPTFRDNQFEVIVLGRVRRASELERAIRGWRDAIDEPDSLRWLLERLNRLMPLPDLDL